MTPLGTGHDSQQHSQAPSFWRSRYSLGFLVMGVIAGYLLLSEHRAHVIGALPLLLLLACPLMHVFMHHGHGSQGSHGDGHSDRHGADAPPEMPPPAAGEHP